MRSVWSVSATAVVVATVLVSGTACKSSTSTPLGEVSPVASSSPASGTGAPPGSPTAAAGADPSASTTALPAAYLAAVADAQSAGPDQLAPLVALAPGSANVVFSADGAAAEMVTLTDWTGYAASVGQPLTLSREVWLTPAPQLQDMCRGYVAAGGTDPSLRSLQYLGMPPKSKPVTIVTMMVPLSGMFRPTANPQLDSATAVFDDGTVQPPDPAFPNHADWFRLQKALAYDPANPYPWTRMGYTYDWGDPANKVGASEFVVRQGTTVDVVADQTPAEYCAPVG
ncbi:MAG: hypothetical protein ACH36H_12060 [Candidatus Nanopelagicales bacterium]